MFLSHLTPKLCSNVGTAVQMITVTDTHPPTLKIPKDVTLVCGVPVSAPPSPLPCGCHQPAPSTNATATDDCGKVTITFSDSQINGVCPLIGTIERTWTATDECGNTATAVQTINATAPLANVSAPPDVTLSCASDISPNVTGTPSFSSSCAGITLANMSFVDSGTVSPPCPGTITRTWTVVDSCGRVYTVKQQITLTLPQPTVTAPPDVNVTCFTGSLTPDQTGKPTFNSSCPLVTVASVTFTDSHCGVCNANASVCGGGASFTRVWTVVDSCGRVFNVTQKIIVTAPPPTVTPPPDTTVPCDGSTTPDVTGEPTFTPGCPNITVVSMTFTDANGPVNTSCAVSKTIIRTWTVVDSCGHSTSVTQKIVVLGPTSPPVYVRRDMCIFPANDMLFCWDDVSTTNSFVR